MDIKHLWLNDEEIVLHLVEEQDKTEVTLLPGQKNEKQIRAQIIEWRPEAQTLFFKVNAAHYKAKVSKIFHEKSGIRIRVYLFKHNIYYDLSLKSPPKKKSSKQAFQEEVTSPLTGRVTSILIKSGQEISANEPLLIIESMKMENELRSSHPGIIKTIPIKENDLVESGQVVVTLKKPD